MLTRFAPSPTGFMHPGNARVALICFLYTKINQGTFILRIDDTDSSKCREEYVECIKADLEWLGIVPDKVFRQSDRLGRYKEVVRLLIDQGRLYPCYESQEELSLKRKLMLSAGSPPIYRYNEKRPINTERPAHYRFRVSDDKMIKWNDEVRGEISVSTKHSSDPIVIREDGTYTYMLPSIIDDIDYGVTNIVRGEDHISNTALQIDMIEALGGEVPSFGHISLLLNKSGKFSKRSGDLSIKEIRSLGLEPMVINSYLANVGTSRSISLSFDMDELAKIFDIKMFSCSKSFFDFELLENLNSKWLQNIKFEDTNLDVTKELWDLVSPNLRKKSDVYAWNDICYTPIQTIIRDRELIDALHECFLEEDWGIDIWKRVVKKLKKKTDLQGKNLFLPIRLALTGLDSGPELGGLVYLIGREEVLRRLKS